MNAVYPTQKQSMQNVTLMAINHMMLPDQTIHCE
jgi:hypothetical protein